MRHRVLHIFSSPSLQQVFLQECDPCYLSIKPSPLLPSPLSLPSLPHFCFLLKSHSTCLNISHDSYFQTCVEMVHIMFSLPYSLTSPLRTAPLPDSPMEPPQGPALPSPNAQETLDQRTHNRDPVDFSTRAGAILILQLLKQSLAITKTSKLKPFLERVLIDVYLNLYNQQNKFT